MAQTQTLDRPQQQPAPRQNLAEVFYADLEAYTPNLRDALPADIPVARFKRVLVTAVSQTPELLYADRRSLFNSAIKCAVDGLIPDGRQAALVVFNTRVKQRDPRTGLDNIRNVDMVQYMPMVAGLRERMRKSGEVASATAEAVFERDQFSYRLGDDPYISHEPPPLGTPRGQVIGAYAIIRLKNGEVIRDVLDRPTIEAARNVSRAKTSPMWVNFYWEGAKKTALRRASKQAPFSSELRQVIDRDEEEPDFGPDLGPGLPRPPEPQRDHYQIERVEPGSGPEFAIIDLDGVESIYASAGAAGEALRLCLDEAARLGPERLEGCWESNQGAIEFLAAAGFGDISVELTRAYEDKRPKPAGRSNPSSQQGAPDPASRDTAQSEPDRGASQPARRPRQTRAAAPPPAEESPAEQAGPYDQLVANETAENYAPDDGEAELDHRMPPTEEPPPVDPTTPAAVVRPGTPASSPPAGMPASGTQPPSGNGPTATTAASRSDLEITVPLKNHKPDYRTWALALFAPKIRRCSTSNELADLMGANEQHLEQARAPGSMTAADLAEMERILAERWQALPA